MKSRLRESIRNIRCASKDSRASRQQFEQRGSSVDSLSIDTTTEYDGDTDSLIKQQEGRSEY